MKLRWQLRRSYLCSKAGGRSKQHRAPVEAAARHGRRLTAQLRVAVLRGQLRCFKGGGALLRGRDGGASRPRWRCFKAAVASLLRSRGDGASRPRRCCFEAPAAVLQGGRLLLQRVRGLSGDVFFSGEASSLATTPFATSGVRCCYQRRVTLLQEVVGVATTAKKRLLRQRPATVCSPATAGCALSDDGCRVSGGRDRFRSEAFFARGKRGDESGGVSSDFDHMRDTCRPLHPGDRRN